MQAVGRTVLEPKPYLTGHEDKLRYQSVLFVAPHDIRGTSYLNIWYYDQNRFPDLFGYVPAFSLDGSAMDIVKAFVLIILGTYVYAYILSGIWIKTIAGWFRKAPVT